MHRTGRSIINFATGVGLQVIILGVGFISTPLLLSWLGNDRYGAFRAAGDWGNYLNLLELGIGGSLMSLLASSLGVGDSQQIRWTLAVGIRAYLKITLIIGLASFCLGCFITHLVPVKSSLRGELQTGYWIGYVSVFLIPLTPFRLLADASQRGYFTNIFSLFQNLMITGVSLTLAKMGFGIPGPSLAGLLGNISFHLVMSWDGVRRYPDIFRDLKYVTAQKPIETRLWQLNWSTLALNLSSQLGFYTDNIIISSSLSPATVVPFLVTQRLTALGQWQIQSIGNATWAALADLHAKGEVEKFNTRLIELTQLVSVIGLASLTTIAAYNHHFISLWVSSDRFGGDGLTLLAAANSFMMGLLSLWGWCFTATGTQPKLVVPTTLAATINFLASITCTHFFGIVGPLMGTFISFTTISIWKLPLLLHEIFGTSTKKLFWVIIKPLMVAIPYGSFIWWIAKIHPPWGWLGLATEMGLSTIIYLIVAWLLVLNISERSLWQGRLKIIFATFRRV